MNQQASIDLGTNTCLLLIREWDGQHEKILVDESTVVRLGQGLDASGALHPDAMARALACIENYAKIVIEHGIDPAAVVAVGTAQARNASNTDSFFSEVQEKTGIQFRTLTGTEEAQATFFGASSLPQSKQGRIVVMDIGGGSTELVSLSIKTGAGASKIVGTSLGIGAVNLTERFLKSDPVTDDEFWKCEDAIDRALETLVPWRQSLTEQMDGPPVLIAVAGTSVTLAMIQAELEEYDRKVIENISLSRGDAHRWVEELKWRSIAERKQLIGMESKRADVILAGALIFWRVMEKFDFKAAQISTRGLRYGVFDLEAGRLNG